jgi:hypothetical protein
VARRHARLPDPEIERAIRRALTGLLHGAA